MLCIHGVAPRLNMGHINIGCGAVCSCRSNLAACGYPRALGVRRHTCGLVQGSRWGGFIAVRVVPVCAVEVWEVRGAGAPGVRLFEPQKGSPSLKTYINRSGTPPWAYSQCVDPSRAHMGQLASTLTSGVGRKGKL